MNIEADITGKPPASIKSRVGEPVAQDRSRRGRDGRRAACPVDRDGALDAVLLAGRRAGLCRPHGARGRGACRRGQRLRQCPCRGRSSVLFRIDTRPFEIAVTEAQAQVERIGQTLGASDGSRGIGAGEAGQGERRLGQYPVPVTAHVRSWSSAASRPRPRATRRARRWRGHEPQSLAPRPISPRQTEELGPQGSDNPQLRAALAALERARLNLLAYDRHRPRLPASSPIFSWRPGSSSAAGQSALSFIDASSIWISATFQGEQPRTHGDRRSRRGRHRLAARVGVSRDCREHGDGRAEHHRRRPDPQRRAADRRAQVMRPGTIGTCSGAASITAGSMACLPAASCIANAYSSDHDVIGPRRSPGGHSAHRPARRRYGRVAARRAPAHPGAGAADHDPSSSERRLTASGRSCACRRCPGGARLFDWTDRPRAASSENLHGSVLWCWPRSLDPAASCPVSLARSSARCRTGYPQTFKPLPGTSGSRRGNFIGVARSAPFALRHQQIQKRLGGVVQHVVVSLSLHGMGNHELPADLRLGQLDDAQR